MKTKKSTFGIFIIALTLLAVSGCKKDEGEKTIESLSGYVQKGPFLNGSSVSVFDLNSDLSASGKTFNTQIADNKGTFELNNITLSSNYVSLRADGFYFNEINGKQSVAQITLNALSDVSDNTHINVNVLTHLEKSRVEYLMKSGKSFSESKLQARNEILAIFSIEKNDLNDFENLNLSEEGEDNAILLAITAILQGFRTESELTELLANISNDIKADGTLDDPALGSALINHAVFIDTVQIGINLNSRYNEIGATVSIPSFGKYITDFITKTTFEITGSLVTYPERGINGVNILNADVSEINSGMGIGYSLAATTLSNMSLKIRLSTVGFPQNTNLWYYSMGSGINWSITPFDFNTYSQTFTVIEAGKSCDLNMFFVQGEVLIEYFETNSATRTRSKILKVL